MNQPAQTHWLARPALVVLACYWLALVLATHAPLPPEMIDIGPGDKTLHLASYFVLAVLMCFNCVLRRPSARRVGLYVAPMLAIYAVLDEWTQIPVGREADVYDWGADCLGAIAGVAAFTAIGAVHRRMKGDTARSANRPIAHNSRDAEPR